MSTYSLPQVKPVSTGLLKLRSRLHPSVEELAQFARRSGALSVLVLARDGTEVISWHRHDVQVGTALAGLAVGQYLARRQLALLLGATNPGTFILYEYETDLLLTAPLAAEALLVALLGTHRSLGAARVALLRLCAQLAPLLKPDDFQQVENRQT